MPRARKSRLYTGHAIKSKGSIQQTCFALLLSFPQQTHAFLVFCLGFPVFLSAMMSLFLQFAFFSRDFRIKILVFFWCGFPCLSKKTKDWEQTHSTDNILLFFFLILVQQKPFFFII